MKKRLLLFTLVLCAAAKAQTILPAIDHDQIKVSKTKTSRKKEFFKAGKLIAEAFYPVSTDGMDDHCGYAYGVCDSTYFYYTPIMMKFSFQKKAEMKS